uniref:Uncharacterized protein n=1 Tax=Noccaea caerulescens TaxID=107243 RepID=A0A1J3CLG7_NOCCA
MVSNNKVPHGAYLGTVKVNENEVNVFKGIPVDLANANRKEICVLLSDFLHLIINSGCRITTKIMSGSIWKIVTFSLYKRISDGLATRKYLGEVNITVVVARYTQDITPEVLANLRANNIVCHHLGYDSENNKPKCCQRRDC